MNVVVKDAVWQILGRVASAIGGFLVIKIITPYLGPLRFGDYSTILKYFAIWSAFADFGIYVIALKQLGVIKNKEEENTPASDELKITYGKFVSTRAFMIGCVYTVALVVAYLIPAYTSNPYLIWGLPLGMLFSASFMSAGILQLPLQLYRKMEQLSIGLILARIAQLGILILTVYIFFKDVDFTTGTFPLPFNLILISVIISGVVQALYVWRKGKIYLPLERHRDRSFTKHVVGTNRQYGVAYYLSSFHTLIVLILLSIFYPTSAGRTYAGTRALALALIEILLIVPSALGNSLIHKVADASPDEKRESFGALMSLVIWIGVLIIVGFVWFAPHLIDFIGGNKYLTTSTYIGSDFILPFLGIVITLSFIKQVFNYIFVSTDLQNKLLKINLIGVCIGCGIGIPLVYAYDIMGGIAMQILLEIVFVLGALIIASKQKVLPLLHKKGIIFILLAGGGMVISKYLFHLSLPLGGRSWLLRGVLGTSVWTLLSYPRVKRILKKL